MGAVHRVQGSMVDRSCPEGVRSNRDRSTPIRRRETKGKVPHHLHSGAGEPAMTGGEPNTTASAGMAFPTTSFETKSTEAKLGISQT